MLGQRYTSFQFKMAGKLHRFAKENYRFIYCCNFFNLPQV